VRFDGQVKPGGYAWWYVDAVSDDGAQALTMIAFIGSVFSPYYAWANRKSYAPAEHFCAMNVVLYEKRGGYWAMTERGAGSLQRGADVLRIGPSGLHWDGKMLTAEIDERCAPIPRRLRGRIKLVPEVMQDEVFELDAAGRHRWQPVAPRARVEVEFDSPKVAWRGQAYFDRNEGDRPLAEDFSEWHWSRSEQQILYDVRRVDGSVLGLALEIGEGGLTKFQMPPEQMLKPGFWGVKRVTRGDGPARVIKTLEDAPFYARSVVEVDGVKAVHESLSLARFRRPWVRMLLPFRMPRSVIKPVGIRGKVPAIGPCRKERRGWPGQAGP